MRGKNGRAQSFSSYLLPTHFLHGITQNKKSPPKRARRPRASRKWSGREKEESKVPPKIDHPPTAATGEITKAPVGLWYRVFAPMHCHIPCAFFFLYIAQNNKKARRPLASSPPLYDLFCRLPVTPYSPPSHKLSRGLRRPCAGSPSSPAQSACAPR